jgi:hypothetical protein
MRLSILLRAILSSRKYSSVIISGFVRVNNGNLSSRNQISKGWGRIGEPFNTQKRFDSIKNSFNRPTKPTSHQMLIVFQEINLSTHPPTQS